METNRNKSRSYDFTRNKFLPFYEKHCKNIQQTVVWGLFQNMMNVMEGNPNANISQKLMAFYLLVSTGSPKSACVCSANLFGPNIQSLCRYAKDSEESLGNESIIY